MTDPVRWRDLWATLTEEQRLAIVEFNEGVWWSNAAMLEKMLDREVPEETARIYREIAND